VTTATLPTTTLEVEAITNRLTLIRVVGDLDLRTVQTDSTLTRLRLAPPRYLRIDATQATFIDSHGLAALAAIALAVRQRGGSVSMKASAPVRRVVELCGVAEHLGLRRRR
jgi:anti-anti-sigma factor